MQNEVTKTQVTIAMSVGDFNNRSMIHELILYAIHNLPGIFCKAKRTMEAQENKVYGS